MSPRKARPVSPDATRSPMRLVSDERVALLERLEATVRMYGTPPASWDEMRKVLRDLDALTAQEEGAGDENS